MRETTDVRVRPLEWEEKRNAAGPTFHAKSSIDWYIVATASGEGCKGTWYWFVAGDTIKGWANSEREAKAAAQADFERRVLSALEPAPKPLDGEWVTVPREPTPEMQKAGQVAADDHRWKWCGYEKRKDGEGLDGMMFHVREGYGAMLAAAPTPPSADSAQDVSDLVEAARNIWPYLVWTIGPDNSACHPTMPSAVAAFGNAFGFPEATEERFARFKRSSTDGKS